VDTQALLTYLKRHLTRDAMAYLVQLDAPLTGPLGLRRWVAGLDLEAFVRLYFNDEFTLDFAPVHRAFLKDMDAIRTRATSGQRGVKLARAIPRGHAKTTFYSRVLPAHGFLYNWSPLTVLLGNTQTSAERLLKNIKEVLERSPEIAEDFPDLKGGTWGTERLEGPEGQTITAFGRGNGGIRGVSNPRRPSLIVGDDLDDDDLVRSQVQVDAATDWLNRAVLQLGDNVRFTTSFVFVGTVLSKTSLIWGLLNRPDFQALVEKGVKRWAAREDLWAEWEAQYLALARDGKQPADADGDLFYQGHKVDMLDGTEVLWDRPDAYYYLMVYRLASPRGFPTEIQNSPADGANTLGRPAYIARGMLPPRSECEWLAALDPTEKGGKKNDLAAYAEAWFHPRTRRLFIVHLDAKRRSYQQTIQTIVDRLTSCQADGDYLDGFWVEENAAGGVISDLLAERLSAQGVTTAPQKFYSGSQDHKSDKIEALAEYTARGQLFLVDDLDAELAAEWEAWPGSRNDDALDAVGTIVSKLRDAERLDLVQVTGPMSSIGA
jgi:hypothetical protein